MRVKSFYVSSNIEGRKTRLEGGTKSKLGRISTKVLQRNRGNIDEALEIQQATFEENGKLMLRTRAFHKGEKVFEYVTEY